MFPIYNFTWHCNSKLYSISCHYLVIFGKKNNTETLMIVPLTKKKKKKNCFEYTTGYTLPMLLRTKQNYYWNLLIETRLQRYLCTFDISFFLISEMEKRDRERERKNRNRVYIYRDVNRTWIGILARRRHRLIITTLSPPLNALINVIGPISDRRWLPPACSLSSSITGWLLRRKLRSKRRRKSQFISFQAGRRG